MLVEPGNRGGGPGSNRDRSWTHRRRRFGNRHAGRFTSGRRGGFVDDVGRGPGLQRRSPAGSGPGNLDRHGRARRRPLCFPGETVRTRLPGRQRLVLDHGLEHGPIERHERLGARPLPAGVNFVSATDSQGSAPVLQDGQISVLLGTIAAGQSATVTVFVNAPLAVPSGLALSASATAAPFDPNLSNNNATATMPVLPSDDLGVTLISLQNTAESGKNLSLAATVDQHGSVIGLRACAQFPSCRWSPVYLGFAEHGLEPAFREASCSSRWERWASEPAAPSRSRSSPDNPAPRITTRAADGKHTRS